MPEVIIKGDREIVGSPVEYSFDPRTGSQTIYRYRCAGDSSPLAGILAIAQGAGWTTRLITGGVESELVIMSPDPGVNQSQFATDTWQIVGNELSKDLFEHPTFATIAANEIADIRQQIQSFDATFDSSSLSAEGQALYDLLLRGTTQYAYGQYVLRHTTNCSRGYNGNVSDTNIEKIYSTAQLLTETQSTSLWRNPIPGRLVNKILSIPTPTVKTGFMWGWRKMPSTETTTPENRIQVDTEYSLEQWSTNIYDPV